MPGTLDIQPFIYEKNFEWWIRSFFYLKSVHFVNALFFWTISFFTRFLQFKFFSTNLPQAFVVTDFRLKMFAASNFDEWTILITFICDFSKSIGKSSTTCKRKFCSKKKKIVTFFCASWKCFVQYRACFSLNRKTLQFLFEFIIIFLVFLNVFVCDRKSFITFSALNVSFASNLVHTNKLNIMSLSRNHLRKQQIFALFLARGIFFFVATSGKQTFFLSFNIMTYSSYFVQLFTFTRYIKLRALNETRTPTFH